MKITTIENPSVQESQPIEAGLRDYGLAQVNGIVPQKWAFHANLRGELIGGATGRVHFSQFYLDNLWVREEFRAKGVGENIHRHVVACAKNCGCRRIQLNTIKSAGSNILFAFGLSDVGSDRKLCGWLQSVLYGKGHLRKVGYGEGCR